MNALDSAGLNYLNPTLICSPNNDNWIFRINALSFRGNFYRLPRCYAYRVTLRTDGHFSNTPQICCCCSWITLGKEERVRNKEREREIKRKGERERNSLPSDKHPTFSVKLCLVLIRPACRLTRTASC